MDDRAPSPDGTDPSQPDALQHEVRTRLDQKTAILEASLDAVITMDHEGKVVEFNSAAERMFGYRRDDAAGRGLADLIIPPRLRAEHSRGLARYMATGEGRVLGKRIEMPALRADGLEFPVELSIVCIATDGPPLFTGYVRDLTLQKQAEQALRANEERFRTLVEMSSDGIFLADGSGVIFHATSSLQRLLGYMPDELIGQLGFTLVHPDDEPLAREILQRAVDRPGEHIPFALRGRHKDGSWRHVDGFCTNHLHNAAVQAVVVNFRDVTDNRRAEEQRRKLEAQVLHAQKLESLGLLAAGIAHEFNNLLQSVTGNATLALKKLPDESSLRPLLRDIERAGQRAADLTRQMSAYAGKSRFIVRPLMLDEIVRGMADLLGTVPANSDSVRLNLEPATIAGDAPQVRQVIMNLIMNASEALAGPEGVISVRTGIRTASATNLHSAFLPEEVPTGACAFVEVEDNGSGMNEETLGRIFDPFFSTKFIGRGLGLAAVLGIVRGHRGVINVTSEPGRGAVFEVLFPAAAATDATEGDPVAVL